MLVHIGVVYVCGNVGEQLLADLICLAGEDDDLHRHDLFPKKDATRAYGVFQRLVFRVAIDAR